MHSPTLLIIATILMGLVTAVIGAMWYFNRQIPGLRNWALSYGLGFAFCLLCLFYTNTNAVWFVVGAQSLLFLTAYLNYCAGRAYVGLAPPDHRPALAALAVVLGLALYFTLVRNEPGLRFVLSSLLAGPLFLLNARTLSRGSFHDYPMRSLFALACAVHGVFLLLRPLLFRLSEAGLFDANNRLIVSHFVVLEAIIAMTLMGFGALMLANEYHSHELRRLAEHDSLTNVLNRRSFLALLEKSLSLGRRKQQAMAVLLLDLDHFKNINDSWGHALGDAALRHFVATASTCLRNEDLIGRLGGEEFAILLCATELSEARSVGERLRSTIANQPLATARGPLALSVSIGLATASADDTPESLLHRADSAMYQAKRNGRNRLEILSFEG